MKTRFAPLLLPTLLLAFGAIAAACGGGGDLTLEEYFQRYEALGNDSDEQIEVAEEAFQDELDGVDSVEDVAAVFGGFLDETRTIFADFRDSLNDIDSPAEVEELHGRAVEILDEGVEALGGVRDRLEDVVSEDDLLELLSQLREEFTEIGGRGEEICPSLQEIADENQIDVDLECAD